MLAGATLATIPVVLLFALIGRYFIKGCPPAQSSKADVPSLRHLVAAAQPGAAHVSPPVNALIWLSAHLPFSSVSMAVTKRAPCNPASSAGCRSVREAMKTSTGAVR